VAYSVMLWLVDPGEQAHQREALQRTTTSLAVGGRDPGDVRVALLGWLTGW
jgi:hypothetical protein